MHLFQIKDNRRADKITSGPQSHILEGVSWEEAKKLQVGVLNNLFKSSKYFQLMYYIIVVLGCQYLCYWRSSHFGWSCI